MQSAGMAGLIDVGEVSFCPEARKRSAHGVRVLVVRFTSLIVCLHISEILLWTVFYRWRCLSTWDRLFTFLRPAIRASVMGMS